MQTFAKITSYGLVGVMIALSAQGGSANATSAKPKVGATAETRLDKSGTLIIDYRGQIIGDTVRYLNEQFETHGRYSHRIILSMDSSGGQIEAGERVIHLLNRMKLTHKLTTLVLPGRTCASMCVPIFLQGQQRIAAPSSVWLFHEAASPVKDGGVSIDREETMRIFRRYFVPAGVSLIWLKEVIGSIKQSNVWQTGQNLIESKSGIITHAIGNRQPRPAVAPKAPPRNTQANSGRQLRFLQ